MLSQTGGGQYRAYLLALACLLAPSFVSADYQAGLDAYLEGDYNTAVVEWRDVVESPPGLVPPAVRAETLYAIGMLFWMGQGVLQDTVEAASWLRLAAGLGHPGAQNKLGFLYSAGQGVMQSDSEAFKWWQMAANQADADAQYNLGVMYRDGLSVKPDTEASMQWFREAAANGDSVSIGIMAQYGENWSAVPVTETMPPTGSMPEPDADAKKPANVTPPNHSLPGVVETDEAWIRSRDPAHYTIQVVAVRQPDKLTGFIANEPNLEPMAIYRQSQYEEPLWVLVQGDYPDLNSARLARQVFPDSLWSREKLWIRRFGMVQSLLK